MVAVEVAEMETEISRLREIVHDLELTNRALETENAMYQARCATAEQAALDELVRSTQMRQILTDMSAMLIAGLNKMEASVDAARRDRAEKEARRLEQEAALEVGSGGLPIFMERAHDAPVTAPSEPTAPEREAPNDDAERGIETSSLDRIPANEYPSSIDDDITKLAQLGEIKTKE